MPTDGKLLARARDALAATREQNEAEYSKRRDELFAKIPALRELERRLRTLMPGVMKAALDGKNAAEAVKEIEQQSTELKMRRAELLVAHGYPSDYLDPIHSCKKCGDSGYIMGKPCSCLNARYEFELTRELSYLFSLGDESFETFRLDYYSSQIDPDTGVSPRECMEYVYGVCVDYAECFCKNSGNLLFQGGTGLGKTFLSACIARVVARLGFSVVYDTAVSALDAFEAEKFGRETSDPGRTRRLLECDLLILDDLGTEMSGSFALSALYTLINSRLIGRKKTIISTNLLDSELTRRYSPQICSRLEGEYQKLAFLGDDIRIIKKELALRS